MKKVLFISLLAISQLAFANDYQFVLKCDYEDAPKIDNPFYFIGKNNSGLIVYLKSKNKIFSYYGGENKFIQLSNFSNEFYEYKYHQNNTPNFIESDSKYSLDRASLRLTETIISKDKSKPLYVAYTCVKTKDEKTSYNDAMSLKNRYDSGKFNQI